MTLPGSRSALARFSCKVAFGLLILSWSLASAQTLAFGTSLGFGPHGLQPEPELELRDVDVGRVGLDFRLAGLAAGPLEVGLGARTSLSYGPVGTVQLSGRGEVDSAGAFRVSLDGAGVITKIAARAHLSFFNADTGRFDLRQAYMQEAIPRTGATPFGVALGLGGSYRLGRRLIVELDPGLRFLAGQGLGGHVSGGLEFRDLVDRDDLAVLLLADLAAGGAQGFAAVGLEYRLSRSDLPVMRGSLWFGAGTGGIFPGLRLSVAEAPRGQSLGYGFELAIEPYRHDALPFRSRSYMAAPVAAGRLTLETLLGYDPRLVNPPFAVGLRYSTSLQ